METDKILYAKVFVDNKTHTLNREHWLNMIKKCTSNMYDNEWNQYFPAVKENFNDCDAPILLYYNHSLNKAIRIIQYDPNVYDAKYRYNQYITAWTSKMSIKELEIPELVICLLLTRNNNSDAERLIDNWLNNNDQLLDSKIKSIYNGQK